MQSYADVKLSPRRPIVRHLTHTRILHTSHHDDEAVTSRAGALNLHIDENERETVSRGREMRSHLNASLGFTLLGPLSRACAPSRASLRSLSARTSLRSFSSNTAFILEPKCRGSSVMLRSSFT